MILQPPKPTFSMSREDVKRAAAAVAADLKKAAQAAPEAPPATGGGSRQRGLPEELRRRFMDVRTALVQRGVYDPVLVRFDTATVPQATTLAVAEELEKVAESL